MWRMQVPTLGRLGCCQGNGCACMCRMQANALPELGYWDWNSSLARVIRRKRVHATRKCTPRVHAQIRKIQVHATFPRASSLLILHIYPTLICFWSNGLTVYFLNVQNCNQFKYLILWYNPHKFLFNYACTPNYSAHDIPKFGFSRTKYLNDYCSSLSLNLLSLCALQSFPLKAHWIIYLSQIH
jgi:hypothetical protein